LRYHLFWWPGEGWVETRRTFYWVDGLLPGHNYTFLITPLDGEHIFATPLPQDVVILSVMSHNSHVDELGDFQVVGEVRNDLGVTVEAVEIRVTFYSPSDEPIFEQTVESLLPLIAPGERAPFRASLSPAGDAASYSLRATARASEPSPLAWPVVLESQGERDEIGFYHVTGRVTNLTEQSITGARAVVTLYDAWGRVVNAGVAYIYPFSLSPGEEGSFDCVFGYFPAVTFHAVQVTPY